MEKTNNKNSVFTAEDDFIELKRGLFVWILMGVENVDSPNALDRLYYDKDSKESTSSTVTPSNFCKIKNGKHSPIKETIKRVLERHPRAEYWRDLPLWEICAGPMDNERIQELLSASDRSLIVPKLFRDSPSGHLIRKKGRAFNVETFIRYLVIKPSWDSLSVLLLLVVEDARKGYRWPRADYFKAAYFVFITLLAQISLAKQEVFRELGEYLHHLINKRFSRLFDDNFPMNNTTSKELVEFFPILEHYLNQSRLIRKRDNKGPLCKHRYNFFLLPSEQRKSVMNEIQALIDKEDFSPSHFSQLALIQQGVFTIKR